jgi:hypothetical protein
LRIGYDAGESDDLLKDAKQPELKAELPPGGGRWTLTCGATTDRSPPSLTRTAPSIPRPPRKFARPPTPSVEELESTTFGPFLELSPPALLREHLGFDHAVEFDRVQLRAYIWGPRGANWSRVGRWQLKVADRFSTAGGAWSTAISPSPWDDAALAAQAFGHEASTTSSHFRAELEPSGKAGALLIAQSSVSLFLFEEGRSIVRVPEAAKQGVAALSGAVKLGSTFYLGSQPNGRVFRVFRVDNGQLSMLTEFPLDDSRGASFTSTLVRNQRGDALAIWVQALGWYLYPIDGTGAVIDAFEIPPPALAKTPRPCRADEDGWVLVGDVTAPVIDFLGARNELAIKRVEARLIATHEGVCVDTMAAQAELRGTLDVSPAPAQVDAFPLILSDRSPSGRRSRLSCGR